MTALAAAPTPLRWVAAIAWMGVIFWLSSRSALPRTPAGDYQSVLGHLGAHAVLALLLAWALLVARRPGTASFAVAWAVAVLYGVSDEIHQSFVPNRHPDIVDVLTDAAGAALALATLRWYQRRADPHRPDPAPPGRIAP